MGWFNVKRGMKADGEYFTCMLMKAKLVAGKLANVRRGVPLKFRTLAGSGINAKITGLHKWDEDDEDD